MFFSDKKEFSKKFFWKMPPLPHPLGPVAMETSLVSPVLQREPNLDSMVAIFQIRVLLSQLYIVKFQLH